MQLSRELQGYREVVDLPFFIRGQPDPVSWPRLFTPKAAMMVNVVVKCVVSGCILLLVSGCSGGAAQAPVPTASVSGTVRVNGNPLSGATVMFFTDEWSSVGKTNGDGEFTLVQGAAVGENKVTISKVDPSKLKDVEFSADPEDGLDEGQMVAANIGETVEALETDVPLGEMIGSDYSDPGKTILTYSVPEGGVSDASFDLTLN